MAGLERGEDDLGDGLGSVGEHEGHLGVGGDGAVGVFGLGVEEDGADAVAEDGSTGLAEGDDGVTFGLERGGEAAELGGLAGAVPRPSNVMKETAWHTLEIIAGGEAYDAWQWHEVSCAGGFDRRDVCRQGPTFHAAGKEA